MSLSVAQALKTAGLSNGRLLAGERNLDNVIEFVSIIEAPLEPAWDIEKTLFLTTFYAVKESLEDQKATIALLAERDCAALVFQSGILDSLPAPVIRLAEKLGLPVIEVPEAVTYPEIIQPLVGAILQEKSFLLQRSDEIHRHLMSLCLAGGGLEAIVTAIQTLVDCPVAIADAWGSLISAAGMDADSLPLRGLADSLDASPSLNCPKPIYRPEDGAWIMELFPGQSRDSDGYILVQDPTRKLDDLDLVAIEQASVIAALEMAKQRAVLETERRLQRDFIDKLLSDSHLSKDTLLAHAHSLGWDLRDKHMIGIIYLGRMEQLYLHRVGGSDKEYQNVKSRFLKLAAGVMKEDNPAGILLDQSEQIIVLPHFDHGVPLVQVREKIQALAKKISAQTKTMMGDYTIITAFGGYYENVVGLKDSYEEAKAALKVCLKLSLPQEVVWYDDVALYVLLDRIAVQKETLQWFERTLGRLVDYDEANGTSLVRTLEIFFDTNQTLQKAAYRLFLHPKTLKYRLRRIEEILGTNPFSKDQQLNYYLACKLARLFDFRAHR